MNVFKIKCSEIGREKERCGCCTQYTNEFTCFAKNRKDAKKIIEFLLTQGEVNPMCSNCFQISLNGDEVPDDVLERIYGYEIGYGRKRLYKVEVLEKIVKDPEDDTNETTKYRIEELYKKVKSYKCFEIY